LSSDTRLEDSKTVSRNSCYQPNEGLHIRQRHRAIAGQIRLRRRGLLANQHVDEEAHIREVEFPIPVKIVAQRRGTAAASSAGRGPVHIRAEVIGRTGRAGVAVNVAGDLGEGEAAIYGRRRGLEVEVVGGGVEEFGVLIGEVVGLDGCSACLIYDRTAVVSIQNVLISTELELPEFMSIA